MTWSRKIGERERERVEGVVEFGETLTKVQAIRNCKLHFAFLVIPDPRSIKIKTGKYLENIGSF